MSTLATVRALIATLSFVLYPGAKVLMKIGIVGAERVGKTALIIQLIQNRFVKNYYPTISDGYRKQVVISDLKEIFLLDILDTSCNAVNDKFMKECDGFLLVFAMNNDKSFDALSSYQEKIIKLLVCNRHLMVQAKLTFVIY